MAVMAVAPPLTGVATPSAPLKLATAGLLEPNVAAGWSPAGSFLGRYMAGSCLR